jgi:biopolymer transport protein ExbB
VNAQEPAAPRTQEEAEALAEEMLAGEEPPATDAEEEEAAVAAPAGEQLNWLDLLLFRGGFFMYPIELISIVVVAFGIERAFGLRRRKVMPTALVDELGQLASRPGGLDPQKAYRVCQQHPSAAANVIRATLLKLGRPHPEVEQAMIQASEREAAKLYSNVRPILLGISVAPLLGLLGTVQGMIMAFFVNVHLPVGANKAQALSEGIYTALVTTLAGLCVAIPASLLAHYYEGRIQALFREIDELLMNLLPQLERYEGKLRVRRVERGEKPAELEVEP